MDFHTMKVSTRLMAGFGLMTTLAVLIAALSGFQATKLAGQLDQVATDSMAKARMFSHLKDNLNNVARLTRNTLLTEDKAFRKQELARIAALRQLNEDLIEELDQAVVTPEGRALLQTFSDARPAYDRVIEKVLQLDEIGEVAAARSLLLSDARDKQNAVFKAVDENVQRQEEQAAQLAMDARQAARRSTMLMVFLAFLAGSVGLGLTWLITRNLHRLLGAEPAELSAAARAVAAGDLAPVTGAGAAHRGSVLAALGDMQSNLASIVAQVRASSDSIATGAAQIAGGNADLSQRTEEQASALQQTAATMEQLGSTVRNTADGASQADQLARGAATVAGKGGEVVDQVVQTMQNIHASSRRIGDITGVIDSIAFQTNILALNAAVEAARAGEQGRGFAVVASEVRTLAQRSAEAAREIKALIGRNVEQVDEGSQLADRAGQTMQEIVGSIRRVADIVSEISTATVQQSGGITQVGDAVGQMDQVTQQNAALVEESAAAAESLRSQASQLVALVSTFRLAAV